MDQQRFRNPLCGLALLVLCCPAAGAAQSGPDVKIVGCSGDVSKAVAAAAPTTAGPLSLEAFDCGGKLTTDPLPENRVLLAADNHEQLLVMVAGKREVLQAVALSDFTQAKHASIFHTGAQLNRQGRVRALFSLYSFGQGASYEWTQGELPKPLPYVLSHWVSVTLAPDASHLLVQHNLSASGAICENDAPCPRESREGTIADLREVETGRILWEIKGVAADIAKGYEPAISPDGRYAIVTLPSTDERMMNAKGSMVLVSMADGTIVQHLGGCPCDMTVSFSPDGRTLKVRRSSQLITYRIEI